MTKSELVQRLAPRFEGKPPTDEQIGELLSISRQAVSAWGETVPALRTYQLRERFPELAEGAAA